MLLVRKISFAQLRRASLKMFFSSNTICHGKLEITYRIDWMVCVLVWETRKEKYKNINKKILFLRYGN